MEVYHLHAAISHYHRLQWPSNPGTLANGCLNGLITSNQQSLTFHWGFGREVVTIVAGGSIKTTTRALPWVSHFLRYVRIALHCASSWTDEWWWGSWWQQMELVEREDLEVSIREHWCLCWIKSWLPWHGDGHWRIKFTFSQQSKLHKKDY